MRTTPTAHGQKSVKAILIGRPTIRLSIVNTRLYKARFLKKSKKMYDICPPPATLLPTKLLVLGKSAEP